MAHAPACPSVGTSSSAVGRPWHAIVDLVIPLVRSRRDPHVDPVHKTGFVDTMLVNSGTEPITVVSRDWTSPLGVHWHAASVTIAPGGRETLRIEADGPICTSRSPLDLGLLETASDTPVTPRYNDVNTLC
jgi:hypothetical protein